VAFFKVVAMKSFCSGELKELSSQGVSPQEASPAHSVEDGSKDATAIWPKKMGIILNSTAEGLLESTNPFRSLLNGEVASPESRKVLRGQTQAG
jgi:hypothetical protein